MARRAIESRRADTSGYSSRQYAEAFSHVGQIQHLTASNSWIIQRAIEQTPYKDAIGCYPLFSCPNWDKLADDITTFPEDVIAFSLVTDPFSDVDERKLKALFPDVCKPFKSHYVLNLEQDVRKTIGSNHQRNAKKALKQLQIGPVADPMSQLDAWVALYDNLIARHNIKGIARFSHDAFTRQFEAPGLQVYQAQLAGEVVGMVLFYEMGDTVYYHLGAYSEAGYAHRASFGIFFRAIEDFQSRHAKWLNLGSGAGLSESEDNGLVRFKKGWSSDTRTAWFCGKILNHTTYAHLAGKSGDQQSSFFPAYRSSL